MLLTGLKKEEDLFAVGVENAKKKICFWKPHNNMLWDFNNILEVCNLFSHLLRSNSELQ